MNSAARGVEASERRREAAHHGRRRMRRDITRGANLGTLALRNDASDDSKCEESRREWWALFGAACERAERLECHELSVRCPERMPGAGPLAARWTDGPVWHTVQR